MNPTVLRAENSRLQLTFYWVFILEILSMYIMIYPSALLDLCPLLLVLRTEHTLSKPSALHF